MTVSVDLWFPDVLPAAQLCPNPIIRREIVNAIRDLLTRTMLWTEELPAISVVADTALYQLTLATADIVGIDRAQFNSKTIQPTSELALDDDETQEGDYNAWRTKTTDIPTRYYGTADKKIRLVYIPDAALTDGLVVWTHVIPLITALTVPSFLWENFKDMVADGARGRLKSILDMPWTDLNQATAFLGSFESQILHAKQKKFQGFQLKTLRSYVRTRYHDF
jgi:hypothetical protein